ncbi:hypothetical protein BKA81DRAFT_363175 [Phyllosticta paracitricarpa]
MTCYSSIHLSASYTHALFLLLFATTRPPFSHSSTCMHAYIHFLFWMSCASADRSYCGRDMRLGAARRQGWKSGWLGERGVEEKGGYVCRWWKWLIKLV